MEETIEGYIEHIIYRNQENGYTVAVYETEDEIPEGKKEIGKQQFIAVGCELPRNEVG